MEEPQITVGILSGKEIEFSFPESFTTPDGTKVSGAQKAVYQKEKIYWLSLIHISEPTRRS